MLDSPIMIVDSFSSPHSAVKFSFIYGEAML